AKVFTKANLQYGTTPFFADRLKEVPRSIKAFSKTPACITYPPQLASRVTFPRKHSFPPSLKTV
ncbi:MAG: hypothetical protein ACI835_005797, partial [Planctomycetota bacterium]